MQFVSTRDSKNVVSFKDALLNCMPADGGLYVPTEMDDLRKWILYADENTSFANLAGTLTSALIHREFSPIICESIATSAFPFEPVVRQLDDNLFIMDLYHGPTGTFKDFGVSYLTSSLENLLHMQGEKSILLDATSGELGACMASAMRGKKLLKSLLVAPKGKFRGMNEKDFIWNGGNIYPIEVDGNDRDCQSLVRKVFANSYYVDKYHLTVANTTNVGRLLPQSFFYTFAFSRIKKLINGSIFFALSTGNCGNLVSGLYSWQLALPVNGFIIPATNNLTCDVSNNVLVMDSMIPVEDRAPANPADPSNIERLEYIFKADSLMLKNFVYPAPVSEEQIAQACRELFVKYKVFADRDTSTAYAAYLARKDLIEDDDGSVVLVARNSPCMDEDFIRKNLGEVPPRTPEIENAFTPAVIDKPVIKSDDISYIVSVLNSLNLRRFF